MRHHSKNGSRRSKSCASVSNRHSFQQLEDRRMLATFTVTSLADGVPDATDGVTTLREAIIEANDVPGADSIAFQLGLTGRILLDSTQGELLITDDLTITGTGEAADLVIDAQQNSRVIQATDAVTNLTLDSLTISNGRTNDESTPNSSGGGILFSGACFFRCDVNTLTLINSTVSGNTASSGGGIATRRNAHVTLTNSTVSGNTASSDDGGGISGYSADVTLTNSTVSGNTASLRGGGIAVSNFAHLTLIDSTVSGNTAIGNAAFPFFFIRGGGISAFRADLTVVNSTVSGNEARDEGGGISGYAANVTLANSTVSGNTASSGGGIYMYFNYNDGGSLTLTNSTISGNEARFDGGGIGAGAFGFNGLSVNVYNSIIAGNSANGAAPDFDTERVGTLTVQHSIIGDTTGTTLTAGNNNLLDIDFTTVLETEIAGGTTVPILTDNGGPVETIALLGGSPAIDAGDNALAVDAAGDPLLNDQRGTGFARLIDGNGDSVATIDIGAVELRSALSSVLLGDANQNGTVNFLDIAPFISLLSTGDFLDQADIDRNGAVNFLDISPFINILSGGSSNSSSLSSLSQLIVSPPATSLSASESAESQITAASRESRQISDGISIELVAPSQRLIEPNEVVATEPEVLFKKSSLQPIEIAVTQGTQSSESLSEPSHQVSDTISVELAAAPAGSTLPTSAVAVADLIASPAEPSLLAFIGAGEVQGLSDSANSQNETPVRTNDLTKLASTKDHAFALARQESAIGSDRPDASLLDGDLELAIWKSSADALDAYPDLLQGLAATQLDEAFEELLI